MTGQPAVLGGTLTGAPGADSRGPVPKAKQRRAPASAGSRPATDLLARVALAALLTFSALGARVSFSGGNGDGSAVRQLLYLLTFAGAIAATRFWERPARLLAIPLTIVLVLLWCYLSLTWSAVPEIGLRRLILTTIIVWTAFLTIEHLGYEASVTVVRNTLIALLAVSYIMVLAAPGAAIHQSFDAHDPKLVGAWRGVFVHKNQAGPGIAFLLMFLLLGSWRVAIRWKLLLVAAAAFFLHMTLSKTSLGLVLAAGAVGFASKHVAREARRYLLPGALVLLCAGVIVVQANWAALTAPFTNPDAFTGRPQIWAPLWRYAAERPFTGAGYGSFWNVGEGAGPIHSWADGWVAVQLTGHSGYLDLLVQLGWPGLILAVTALLLLPIGRLLFSAAIPPERSALLLTGLLFAAGHNVTESSLLDRDMLPNVLTLITLALVVTAPLPRSGPRSSVPTRRPVPQAAGAGNTAVNRWSKSH